MLTSWFWYAVTPMKFVSAKVNVFISSDLRLITEAVWSRLRIICTLGWYLCMEFRMSWKIWERNKLARYLHVENNTKRHDALPVWVSTYGFRVKVWLVESEILRVSFFLLEIIKIQRFPLIVIFVFLFRQELHHQLSLFPSGIQIVAKATPLILHNCKLCKLRH